MLFVLCSNHSLLHRLQNVARNLPIRPRRYTFQAIQQVLLQMFFVVTCPVSDLYNKVFDFEQLAVRYCFFFLLVSFILPYFLLQCFLVAPIVCSCKFISLNFFIFLLISLANFVLDSIICYYEQFHLHYILALNQFISHSCCHVVIYHFNFINI